MAVIESGVNAMPLYDYRCPHCNHLFEARHRFEEPAPP
ncbi:MAG: hypothetical protein K8J31_28705, partial [Anaerolineae bacterium]|nr:hypothetical protein [Anaerolineae bacterium]